MSTPPPYPGQQPGQPQFPAAGPYQPYPGQQPGFPQPGAQPRGAPQPGMQQPGMQQPGFQQQGFQQPGYQQGGFQQPGYQDPGFQQYPQQQYPQQGMYPQIGMGPGRIGGGAGFGPGPSSVKLAQIALIVTVAAWAVSLIIRLVQGDGFAGGGFYFISRFLLLGVALPLRFLRTGSNAARIVSTVFGVLYAGLMVYNLSDVFRFGRYFNALSWVLVLLDVIALVSVIVAIVFLYRRDANYFFSRR